MKRLIILTVVVMGAVCLAAPASAQLRRAERALKNQEYDSALEHVAEVLADKPDNAKAYELRGRIHQEMAATGPKEEYFLHLVMMMEDFNQASELDDKLAGTIEDALRIKWITEFNLGIEAFNNARTPPADALMDENAYFMQSARHFQASSIVAPDSMGSYINWAFALLGAGADSLAIEPLTLALEWGEPDMEVFDYLSRIYISRNRPAEAVPVLEKGTEAFPESEDLQNRLLNAYVTSNQIDRAVERYGQALERYEQALRDDSLDPDTKNEINRIYTIYLYNHGSLLLQSGRHEEAIEQLEKTLERDATYVDAQYNLGAAYVNKAVEINNTISEMDDDLRARRDSLSEEKITSIEARMDELAGERRELFSLAVAPLEEAKRLGEQEGRDVSGICRVLFQSYVQTNQMDKVPAVEACADGESSGCN